jgi:hypothetical protein
MENIPVEVREYLSTGDGLGRAAVEQRYPKVKIVLNLPETRRALLEYLASDDPWLTPSPGFAMSTLTFVLSGAVQEETRFVRPLVLHPVAEVRLRAYTFLAQAAMQDRVAQVELFEAMVMDSDDMVRSTGARLIEQTKTVPELRPLLERWLKVATARGWSGESKELIERLVKQ